jgi:hypothetical protein
MSKFSQLNSNILEVEEASSIIIDTKMPGGNPILSKEQKQRFMRRSLGEEEDEENEDSEDESKRKKGYKKPMASAHDKM